MEETNKSTLLMMAAAHLFRGEIEDDIKERLEHPYKAEVDESGIELKKIQTELQNGKSRENFRNIVYTLITFITIPAFFISQLREPEIVLIFAFFAITIVEFIYQYIAKKNVKKIIKQLHNQKFSDLPQVFHSPQVVISGGFSPFIGAGVDLDSWSFPINLTEQGDSNRPSEDVKLPDMHMWIKNHLSHSVSNSSIIRWT